MLQAQSTDKQVFLYNIFTSQEDAKEKKTRVLKHIHHFAIL